MPLIDTPESNPDLISDLYQQPDNEALLAEMALASSGPGIPSFSPVGGDSVSQAEAWAGIGGGSRFKRDPEDLD